MNITSELVSIGAVLSVLSVLGVGIGWLVTQMKPVLMGAIAALQDLSESITAWNDAQNANIGLLRDDVRALSGKVDTVIVRLEHMDRRTQANREEREMGA